MKYVVKVNHNGKCYAFDLLEKRKYQCIHIDDCIHILIAKHSNYKYEICGFFYKEQHIECPKFVRTKKELYDVINILLEKYL